MSDRTIDEATPDTQVTGVENIPVSDGGSPKCVTVTQVKDFVLSKIGTIANVSTPAIATDGVYIKRNSELKPISAQDLANAIISFAFSKEEVSTLTTEAVIVIKSGNDIKTTDVNELAGVVKNAIELDAFNIRGLPEHSENPISGAEMLAVTEGGEGGEVGDTCRTSLNNLVIFVIGSLFSWINENTAEIGNNDYFLTFSGVSPNTPRKVKLSNSGLGKGNVYGAVTETTVGNVPKWTTTDGKHLGPGYPLVSSFTAQSTSDQLATAAGVYQHVVDAMLQVVKTTSTTYQAGSNVIMEAEPSMDGKYIKTGHTITSSITQTPNHSRVLTEKAVTDALATKLGSSDIATSISASPSDSKVSSEKAVSDALANKLTKLASTTDNGIPQWDGTQGSLKNGKALSTTISSSSTDSQIPTAKAVYDAITGTDVSNLAKVPNATTQGNIPKWGSTQKTFDYSGYSVATTLGTSESDTSSIPTSGAVRKAINRTVQVESSAPSNGRMGYGQGKLWYNTGSNNPGLYVNIGDEASSAWVLIGGAS